MGRTCNKTVQCVSGSMSMVLGLHGRGHLVASAGTDQVSQSDGTSDVPTAVHTRYSTIKVTCKFLY